MHTHHAWQPGAIGAGLLLLAATGCSTFTTTRKLDMQPFAENTVTSIGELRRLDRPPPWVRLRSYRSEPAVLEVAQEYKPMQQLLRAVSTYSIQLVALNDAKVTDARKIRELVRYLREAAPVALEQAAGQAVDEELALTQARLEAVLQEMSRQETFMGALAAAEPIVAGVQARGLMHTDRLSAAVGKAGDVLEGLIQAQYGGMVANRDALVALQERVMKALTLAERASLGEQAALDELRRDTPVARELIRGDRKPTAMELQAATNALTAQLRRLQVALEQIKPEYDAYRESLAELDAMRNQVTERVRLERSILMVWARSHRSLGRGVEVPPAFDLARILSAGASKAAGALPF
jgi:hypothetical protein